MSTHYLAIRERLVQLLRENRIIEAGAGLEQAAQPRDYDQNLFQSNTLNSMDVPYMLALIEEEFGVVIDETLLAIELNNLNAIAVYIAEHRLDMAA